MGKKKPEMQQVYNPNNEFIFGENGGKGRNLSSFLRNLSISNTSSSSTSSVANTRSVSSPIDSTVIGASYAHVGSNGNSSNVTKSPYSNANEKAGSHGSLGKSPEHKYRQYTDLDDDWDSNVDNSLKNMNSAPKSIENKPNKTHVSNIINSAAMSDSSRSSLNLSLQPSPMLDSLYPDLTLQASRSSGAGAVAAVSNSSLDKNDLRTNSEIESLNAMNSKYIKFKKHINDDNINLDELKKTAWNGIPSELRPISWQLLLGYLPTNSSRRVATLERKRKEYLDGIEQLYNTSNKDPAMWHQIKIDVPRTNPHIKLYSFDQTQESLKRILYLWSIRHPASGYVQGINDLATPFYQVFLSSYISSPIESFDPAMLPKEVNNIIEADTFWCLTKLLDDIQDNYIHEQPGIIRQVNELQNLIGKIDTELLKHFQSEGIEFIQFSFRWMNCLLMREVKMDLVIRMWDTYLSENPTGFKSFHVYVCSAFLIRFSDELKKMDFQEIMLFLQNPPTQDWTVKDIELIMSEAYIWQSLYKNASAHLR